MAPAETASETFKMGPGIATKVGCTFYNAMTDVITIQAFVVYQTTHWSISTPTVYSPA
jgi:hypothetical protein